MRIAIVTGASSGMGAEFVRQCVYKWNDLEEIWIIARRKDKLEALQQELSAVSIRVVPMDITKEEDRKNLARTLTKEQPEVRLLVNSAGVGKSGHFGSKRCERETEMVRLNCEALVAMTYEVLPYMTFHSHIIQMASGAAFTPQPNFAVYAATKAFVYNFSRALAQELKGTGTKVTIVCPGPVDTEFLRIANGIGGKMPWYKKLVMAKAEDVVAKAIRDAKKGKIESIYGISMKLCKIAGKLFPWNIILMFYKKS